MNLPLPALKQVGVGIGSLLRFGDVLTLLANAE